MAISGESFGPSAKKSMFLHLKHCSKFDRALNFTNLYLLLVKIALIFLNLGLMYGVMIITGDTMRVSSIIGPGIFVAINTWFTADMYIGIFEQITYALFTSYAIDIDINKG